MKTKVKSIVSVILALVFVFAFVSCNKQAATGVWESATYLEDTTLGSGAKTLTVEVTAEDKTVTFTVKTDKDTVGAALIEHGLIAGDESQYGLYVKVVNGITADYDVNQRYWAFYIDGEYASTGVDSTSVTDGAHYEFRVE